MGFSVYEERIRERFPALVADPLWPMVERLLGEADARDDDEGWFPGVEQHCIDLCKRIGLPFGPAHCNECEKPWPEIGDVPDGGFDPSTYECVNGGVCPRCQDEARATEERKAAEKAAYDAWYAGLAPEERARHDFETKKAIDTMIDGLISRDVQ